MGADKKNNGFVPIRDAAGKLRGLMDRVTADFIASNAPNATQESIDALLSQVTRVRVVGYACDAQGEIGKTALLDTSDSESLASFRACFAIGDSFGHRMSFANANLEFYSGNRKLATLGYFYGGAIRWDAWRHDASLKDPEEMLDWMTAHGVHHPRQTVEANRRESERTRRNRESWLAAMSECFRPFWGSMALDGQSDPALHRALLKALRAALPDETSQVLCLFEWFGSGAGPWSGYAAYESVPCYLLLRYPTRVLITALAAGTPNQRQWIGAARYFASWDFSRAKESDRSLLTPELRAKLREAARATGIADNIERAEKALA